MIDYQAIIDNLSLEKIKDLFYRLGAEDVIEKPGILITNTICHNEENGSMKLYYYENSRLFMCFTNCGSMTIFQFLKHYYETRGIDYDWYKDIYQVILDCSNYDPFNNFTVKKYTVALISVFLITVIFMSLFSVVRDILTITPELSVATKTEIISVRTGQESPTERVFISR